LAVFATRFAAGDTRVLNLFGNRYHRNGDRRLGFYTLVAATPAKFHPGNEYWTGRYNVRLDPATEHPDNPLARYLARQFEMAVKGRGEFGNVGGPAGGFVRQLAAFHDIWFGWHGGTAGQNDAQRLAHWRRGADYARSCTVPLFKWTVLDLLQRNRVGTAQVRELTELYRDVEEFGGLTYAARYEQARTLANAGDRAEARNLFTDLSTAPLN